MENGAFLSALMRCLTLTNEGEIIDLRDSGTTFLEFHGHLW